MGILSSAVRWGCMGVVAAAMAVSGCKSSTTTDSGTRTTTTTRTSGSTIYRPSAGNGYSVTEMAFPTGDVRSSAIMLHQVMPSEVTKDAPYTFEYHVTNLGGATLQNVVLALESSSNISVRSSSPEASSGGSRTVWTLGELGPRETRVIEVTGVSGELGTAGNCISVSYNNVLCAATEVVQPALAIRKTATPRALLCDPIQYTITVENTGSGVAKNVRVRDELPEGVVTAGSGSRTVDQVIGDIQPGQSATVTIDARATRTGTFGNSAVATGDGDLRVESGYAETIVTQPVLTIAADCRQRQYLQRDFTHTYTVSNTGDGQCDAGSVVVDLPAGAEFVSASAGGTLQGSQVVFDLGGIAPNASRQISVTMRASQAGRKTTTATAQCECAEVVSDSCYTDVTGIPAIVVEMVDELDPVEVGTETTYVIRVRNQGTAPDTNIRVVAILPGQLEFVGADGATNASRDGNRIRFAPVATLAPGAEVTWRLTVRATGTGDVRTGLEVTSDKDETPIRETESTNLYSEAGQ